MTGENKAFLIVVSDFVCPWCYVGLTEVERLQREYDIEVAWAPYLLDPSTPPEGKPRRQQSKPGDPPSYLEQRGADSGITFRRGRTWTSNSHLAHEAAEFAAEHGDASLFHKAMFKAYFDDLEDIGKVDTIVRIGSAAGLDGYGLREALETRRYREDVDNGIEWARSVGVTAVPAFIFNEEYAVVGAQDYPVFKSVMEKLNVRPIVDGTDD